MNLPLIALLTALQASAPPAHADAKTFLDIDQCLDNLKKSEKTALPSSDGQVRCVEEPFAGQKTSAKEITRLCEFSSSDPDGFRTDVRRNSFRVSPDLVEASILRKCDRLSQDAKLKAEREEKRKAIEEREAALRKQLDEAQAASLKNAAVGDAARDSVAKRTYTARKRCEKAPLCSTAQLASVDFGDLRKKASTPAEEAAVRADEAAYRNLQVMDTGWQNVKKTHDDLNLDYGELARADRCFSGAQADLRGPDGKIKDSELEDSEAVLNRYESLSRGVAARAASSQARSEKLKTLLDKWDLKLKDEDVAKSAGEYQSGAQKARASSGWAIRQGDAGHDECRLLLSSH